MMTAPPDSKGYSQSRSTPHNSGSTGAEPQPDPAASARHVTELARQILDMGVMWIATRIDLIRAKAMQWIIAAILIVMALAVVLVAVIVATVYLLESLAMGIGELAGHRPWVGHGAVGLLILGGIGLGGWIFTRSMKAKLGHALAKKYSRWQQSQADRYNHA